MTGFREKYRRYAWIDFGVFFVSYQKTEKKVLAAILTDGAMI
jgi:hypothetical protein